MRLRIAPIAAAMLLMAAQADARSVRLYAGEPLGSVGIKVSAWGSGSAKQSSDPGPTGTNSIEMDTSNLYSGAFITFDKPVEIADPAQIAQNDYLHFELKFKTMTQMGLTDPSRTPSAKGDFLPLPLDYYGNYYGEDLPQVPKVRIVRVVLYSADGRVVSHSGPVVVKQTDEDGWIAVMLPLAGFGLNAQSRGFPLKSICIGGDYADKIWIGEIGIITDDSQVYVDSLDEQDVGTLDVLLFRGVAEAGRTPLLYSWDFNSRDGIQEDAVGELVQVVYRKAGTYTVTLTVKDPDGLKKSATTSADVTVN